VYYALGSVPAVTCYHALLRSSVAAGSRRGGRVGEAEDTLGVAVQEQVRCLVIEAEAGEVLRAVGRVPGRVIGPEQHLVPTVAAQVVDQLAG
jgi:hypothetical protein